VIRVLQLLTSTALGGGPRQVLHLVRHLPADEFQVSVAGPPDERFAEDLRAVGIEPAVVRVDSLRALPLTLHRVMGLVRDTRADVVHTHGKGAGFYGRVAAKLAGVPAVHTFHGIHYETYSLVGSTRAGSATFTETCIASIFVSRRRAFRFSTASNSAPSYAAVT